jgi:peptidoglycan-associated lipoprotein
MTRNLTALAAALLLLAACGSTPDAVSDSTAGSATGAGGLGIGDGMSSADLGAGGFGTGGPVTPGSQEDLEVNVGDRVFFAFDSAALDDAARLTLERQASWLRQFPAVSVVIEGHTDERGTAEYNLALGQRRAEAARSFLVAQGVEPFRLQTISFGKERPADPGHNETAWALNRRAVTAVSFTN